MTAPNADQVVAGNLGGTNASTGAIEAYQFQAECGGRVTYSSNDSKPPYVANFGAGDVVGSAATYDQVASAIQFIGSRHIDPYGNAVNLKKVWLVLWYWFLDGAPPITEAKRQEYITLADQLRPWPQTLVDEWTAKGYKLPPGEQTMDYSAVTQSAPLSSFLPTTEK